MICKSCNEEKTKEPVIRKDVTRFVDQLGRLWNGKVCPDCYKVYNRERMRTKRLQKHSEDENSKNLKID
jgi:type II secretory ATPase GspE/PulE/Tfp pilus assembly ATPase PilB-like protein